MLSAIAKRHRVQFRAGCGGGGAGIGDPDRSGDSQFPFDIFNMFSLFVGLKQLVVDWAADRRGHVGHHVLVQNIHFVLQVHE